MPSVAIVGGGFGGVGAAALAAPRRAHGRDAVRARRAPRRRLAPQHLSGRGVRHPVAPVRVLVRAQPELVAPLRAAGRDPGLRRGRGAALGRRRAHVDRGAFGALGWRALGAGDERRDPRRRRPDHRLRAALAAERPAAAGPRVVCRPRVPHRAVAPRRAARGPAGGGDRHGLQRRPGRARDRRRGRVADRLSALARLDDPEARLRLSAPRAGAVQALPGTAAARPRVGLLLPRVLHPRHDPPPPAAEAARGRGPLQHPPRHQGPRAAPAR